MTEPRDDTTAMLEGGALYFEMLAKQNGTTVEEEKAQMLKVMEELLILELEQS